ncbi:Protein of unknown function [Amycolatopsis arida]|uniref:DUF3558 domain-containing protein n=1 Tax=Amycolatopsis arida TaxID=587909 RepID=A0A1I5T3T0_9PSEU|nr:DUF3558 domain-containing protein [Amycolatopsis arida]TDX96252.1 uncharacterized protein DUF3558 [Amycolatopsis arida]SFP77297.1 Protein of unknown function [Amycolatopsis arida]
MLLVVLAAALAGCGGPEGGRAVPAPGARQPAELPPRPRELPVRGADPCALLTERQLDELGVNSRPRRDGAACSFDADRAEPFHSYVVEVIGDADVRAWLDGDRASATVATESGEVVGFPAVTRYRPGGRAADCEVLVGVADGQTLRTQAYPISAGAFDQRQLCARAERAAAMAVATLAGEG